MVFLSISSKMLGQYLEILQDLLLLNSHLFTINVHLPSSFDVI
jgi:hypothetical protein